MSRNYNKALIVVCSLAISGMLLTGCAGKEERQAKYLERAQQYFAKGNYDKARIEAKNVLQINANNAEAHYVFAQIAERQNNWQQMFGELNAALYSDPRMLKARTKLAQLFVIANQLDKATEQANKIKAQDPNSPDYYAIMASIAERETKPDEAIKDAQKALSIKPGHIGATALLASLLSDSDPAKSEQIVSDGIRLNPDEEDLRVLQVQILAKHNKVDETIAKAKELIARYPDRLAYISQLANYYIAQKRIAEADDLLRQTIRSKPDNTDMKLLLVEFMAKQKTPEEGLAQLSQYLSAEPDNYKLRSALARFYVAANQPDKAIATYQYTIDKDVTGEGIDARNQVIKILLGQNKRANAEPLLKDVLKLEPANTDALLIRARLEMADNNTDAAIADLRTLLKSSPDAPQALLMLAAAQERTGASSLALDNYKRILETNSNNVPALIGAAQLQLAANNLDDAKTLLDQAHSLDAKNLDASRLLVELYSRKQQWQPALALCDQLIANNDSAAVGYYLKGLVLLQTKDSAAAIESLKKSLDKEPRAIEPLQKLIFTYAATKQVGTAVTYLENYISANPNQIYAQEMLGELYRQTGKLQQAETLLVDVIKKQPARISAYKELLGVYSLQKQPEKMAALLENGLKNSPNNVDLMLLQAQLYQSTAQDQQALQVYEKALALQPNSDLIKNNLAALLIDKFPSDENLRRAQVLIAGFANSNNPVLLDTLAWLQYKMKNYPQAIALLEGVVANNFNSPEIHYHLGMAYLKNGASGKAKIELQKATETKTPYPDREEAAAELKKL